MQRGKRTDIQALRALAVGLVLVFHLAPGKLSGGYVGVDVFFVISGFLITSHLLTSPPRRAADLVTFWSRRIARLLPAAFLVLAVTLVASRLVGPETQWADTADDVTAAGFYVVNWRFADQAVDYLAADDLPSPVQHYWSLSVEEQFYAGWPVLLLALFALAGLTRLPDSRHRALIACGLAAVTAASLGWSIHLTAADPARAYFVTPTRIWELGVGGVLACLLLGVQWGERGRRARAALAVAGLAAILWSAWDYTGATPFPGWRALVPVLGTAAVIAAEPGGPLGRALGVRPVQFVGDISYSVYLWHWPMIVLLPELTNRGLDAVDKVGILLATLVLASMSKRWVEDPFQRPRTRHPVGVRFAGAATGMAVLAAMTALQGWEVRDREAEARRELVTAAAAGGPCFGAAALASPACAGTDPGMAGSPAQAALDKSQAYPDVEGGRDCFSYLPDFRSVRCDFGPAEAQTTVALVGNSHAGHWLPALQQLASRNGWRISTFLSSQCALAAVPQQFATVDQTEACVAWVGRTVAEVAASGVDAVVVSNRLSVPVRGRSPAESLPVYERGYRDVLTAWGEAGLRVLAIRDTPTPGIAGLHSIPDCLASNTTADACAGTPQAWLPAEPMVTAVAAAASSRVRIVDLTDRICGPRSCDPVVGGVVVYFDGSHLTATYARTLAPFLAPDLEALLRS